jgi:hypothetical protein
MRVFAVRTDADAPAHDESVHQGNVGLGVFGDQCVELVLVEPEVARFGAAATRTLVDGDDVAAGAQPAFTGALQHHLGDMGVLRPLRRVRQTFWSPSRGQ